MNSHYQEVGEQTLRAMNALDREDLFTLVERSDNFYAMVKSCTTDTVAAVIGLIICLLVVGFIGAVIAAIAVYFIYTAKWRRSLYKVVKNMTLDEYNFLCKNQSDFKIPMPKHLELL